MQGHAGANLVPVVASNRIGKETFKDPDSKITFYGTSFIAGESDTHESRTELEDVFVRGWHFPESSPGFSFLYSYF
jgi:N-carbamoylputrescine amidase